VSGGLEQPEVVAWTLDQLKSGDACAWRAAYAELWRVACAALSRRVFSRESVEDLAQETLVVVAAEVNTFADERHIKAVTRVIAARRAAHFLRDETADRRDRRRETTLDAAAEVAAALPAAHMAVDLGTLLSHLDVTDRALVEGRYLEGLQSGELAARHHVNANTVRGRLARAIAELSAQARDTFSTGVRVLVWLALLHFLPLASRNGLGPAS